MPEKLAEQVDLLERMPDVALVDGAILYWASWDPASTMTDRVVLTGGIADRRLDPPEALLTMYPLGPNPGAGVYGLVRRSAFDAVGGWEDHFHGLYDDTAFLAKIFMRYPIYISSQTWYHYRQHDASCCAQTSRMAYVRSRADFLEWLEMYVRPFDDPQVVAAVRRARRELPYQRLTVPAYELFDRLPQGFRRRVRALAGR
jgi:hypothetical protein